jgi:hypothetical protein
MNANLWTSFETSVVYYRIHRITLVWDSVQKIALIFKKFKEQHKFCQMNLENNTPSIFFILQPHNCNTVHVAIYERKPTTFLNCFSLYLLIKRFNHQTNFIFVFLCFLNKTRLLMLYMFNFLLLSYSHEWMSLKE